MQHETSLVSTIAVSLAYAFVGGFGAYRLGLPPLVGYLLAGIAVGPFTPGYVADVHLAGELADIGIVLLMFGIGMHFSLRDLAAVYRTAVPGALAQIACATAIGIAAGKFWGWPLGGGLVFGLALSAASTAVLLRTFEARRLEASSEGRLAIAWLIVADLVMVLALVLLPVLAPSLGGNAVDPPSTGLWTTIGITLAKLAGFTLLMLVVAARILPWLLDRVARTGSRELFTLAVMTMAVGIGFGSAELFGISFAMGAFLAGMVVNESDHSHRASKELQPLQDAFAALFFVSVGMLFDPAVLVKQPLAVLCTLLAIYAGNGLSSFLLLRLFRYPMRSAATVAAGVAQTGEFAFIVATLGGSLGLLPEAGKHLVLAGALLSITLNPLLFAVLPVRRSEA